MRIKHLFVLALICLYTWACSTEKTANPINGIWSVEVYEIVDCLDTLQNIFVDITADTCFAQGGDSVCITSFTYNFDSLGRSQQYVIEREQTINGVSSNFQEQGNYNIEGLNRLVLCKPECDSMFVIRNGFDLEIVDADTLSGCGTVIRAVKIN